MGRGRARRPTPTSRRWTSSSRASSARPADRDRSPTSTSIRSMLSARWTSGRPAPPSCSCTASGSGPESFAGDRAALAAARSAGPPRRPRLATATRHAGSATPRLDRVLEPRRSGRPHHRATSCERERATRRVGRSQRRCHARRDRRHADGPAVIAGALLHEPLIGSSAADLTRRGYRRQPLDSRPASATPATVEPSAADFVAGLVGAESWAALGADGRAAVDRASRADRRARCRASPASSADRRRPTARYRS